MNSQQYLYQFMGSLAGLRNGDYDEEGKTDWEARSHLLERCHLLDIYLLEIYPLVSLVKCCLHRRCSVSGYCIKNFGDPPGLNQDVQCDFSLRKDLSIQKALFIVRIK